RELELDIECALRCLWSAACLDYLLADKPVSCPAGDAADLPAFYGRAQDDLSEVRYRPTCAIDGSDEASGNGGAAIDPAFPATAFGQHFVRAQAGNVPRPSDG